MNFFCEISLLGHNTRKCAEYFWVNLLIFAQISRNIHKSCFLRKFPGLVTRKSIDFRVTIPGYKIISGYCYSEINLFPGIVTWKSIDFRVTIPRNQLISGYCAPELKWNFAKKNRIFLFLNSCTTFKTEYIYKNQLWTICKYIGLWFEVKKNGVI